MQGTFEVYVEPGIVLTPEVIRNGRRALALTQAKFSTRVGVAPETESRWERGRLTPRKKNQRKIVEVLKLTAQNANASQTGEKQEGRQLTEQGTGPADNAGPDGAGKGEAHRTVPDCRTKVLPQFTEAISQAFDAMIADKIADKIEKYMTDREKAKE